MPSGVRAAVPKGGRLSQTVYPDDWLELEGLVLSDVTRIYAADAAAVPIEELPDEVG